MAGKFTIYKTESGKFRFNLKASNGEIILVSELYNAKASAKKGIESVKKHSADVKFFEDRSDKSGKLYFVLKAANHEVIGVSESYESEKSRNDGKKSITRNAAAAMTVDETTVKAK